MVKESIVFLIIGVIIVFNVYNPKTLEQYFALLVGIGFLVAAGIIELYRYIKEKKKK